MIDQTSAWLIEIPEVPRPPLEYEDFAVRRAMWQLLGATTNFEEMTWAEIQEAKVFAMLEEKHPQRFKGRVQ